MNEYDVKRLALVLAIQAEIEGMKAENLQRTSRGLALAYDETSFREMSERLYQLGTCHNDQL